MSNVIEELDEESDEDGAEGAGAEGAGAEGGSTRASMSAGAAFVAPTIDKRRRQSRMTAVSLVLNVCITSTRTG